MSVQVWSSGARQYGELASTISFYQVTSKSMVEQAAIREGMVVVDLACGASCIITRRLLELREQPRRIYCVDYSSEMIESARASLHAPHLTFVTAAAEEVAAAVPEHANTILCNSAFLLFDIPRALRSIHQLLVPGGAFLFSFAEWQTDQASAAEHPKYRAIAQELAQRGLPPKQHKGAPQKLSPEAIQDIFHQHHFRVDTWNVLDIPVALEDWRTFYSIPSFASMSLPHLPVELALDVLQAAMQRLEGERLPLVRWYVARMISLPHPQTVP